MTRGAAEGARAAAVELASAIEGANDPRRVAAVDATNEAVTGFGKTCGAGGMTCLVQIHDCGFTILDSNVSAVADNNGYFHNPEPDCVTVRLIYDYQAHPLLAPMPLIAAFLPDQIQAKSVVRLNE
jgi:hypothetical protein